MSVVDSFMSDADKSDAQRSFEAVNAEWPLMEELFDINADEQPHPIWQAYGATPDNAAAEFLYLVPARTMVFVRYGGGYTFATTHDGYYMITSYFEGYKSPLEVRDDFRILLNIDES